MFRISWASCIDISKNLHAGNKIIARNNNCVFLLGDFPYLNHDVNKWGSTPVSLDKDSSVADITTHYTQMWAIPEMISLTASSVEVYMIPDDHEWMGDNWDGSIAQATSGTGALVISDNAAGQAEANTHHARARESWEDMAAAYTSNPANTHVSAVNDIAPAAFTHGATPTASDYSANYYKVMKDVNGNVVTSNPHVEFFVLDCISHRSALADTDNAAKSMLGLGTGDDRATDGQYHWLATELLASTATFKVIMSPKKTYKNSGADNTDTWGEYTTERDLILAYIDTNSITGVLWCVGDRHTPAIIKTTKTAGDTYDHLCICACPVGVDLNAAASSTTLTQNTVQFWSGSEDKCFGELEITENYIDIRVINSHNIDNIMWKGKLLAGENRLDETGTTVSI